MDSVSIITNTHTRIKKKRQGRYAFFFLLFNLFVILFLLYNHHVILAVSWLFGMGFGIVLQRSRFCLTSSFRDIFMTGDTSLARAVIFSLIISTVGFALLIYLRLPGEGLSGLYIRPFGLHTAFGAVLFGMGMVIAGSCASGTLWRMGEGYLMQWVVFIGFLAGSIIGAWHYGWWYESVIRYSPTIFLPDLFGWPMAVAAQLLLLAFLYKILWRIERGRENYEQAE
jgi:hypothetical protein